MPVVPNQQINVGGNTLYPTQGLLNPNLPIIRPEYGQSGLLDPGEMDNLVRDFAGGLLNGYQVNTSQADANGMFVNPIAPSGVYTTDPDQAAPSQPPQPQQQGSGLSFLDALYLMQGPGMNETIQDRSNFTDPKQLFDVYGLDPEAQFDPNNKEWQRLSSYFGRGRSGGGDGGYGGDGGGAGSSGGGDGTGGEGDGGGM